MSFQQFAVRATRFNVRRPYTGPEVHTRAYLGEKVSVPFDITLRPRDSYPRARRHCNPSWTTGRSPLDVGRLADRRRDEDDTVGRPGVRWRPGEKSRIAVFTSGRRLVTLRKSRQSRRSRHSEWQSDPTRSAGCVCCSGIDCATALSYISR